MLLHSVKLWFSFESSFIFKFSARSLITAYLTAYFRQEWRKAQGRALYKKAIGL